MEREELQRLKEMALSIRRDVLEMTYRAGANGGHLGGAFSCADILAVLYGKVLHLSPAQPSDSERDRFFLSKGHVAIAHYAALAETGFLSRDELLNFEQSGSEFPTHEVINPDIGVESSSGSLGYGLSVGIGSALYAKRHGLNYHVYVLMGDGECNEGSIWEAAMAAARLKLDNLTAVVDVNGQSLDGFTAEIMPVHDFKQVWSGFGWQVEVADGHDLEKLAEVFSERHENVPLVVLAQTVKGQGLPSIANKSGWHHARLSEEQYLAFKQELEANVS
ncbi:MAG: transketolase [Selenomonas sp.]|nr:transketolase [Selenomonas sp.]